MPIPNVVGPRPRVCATLQRAYTHLYAGIVTFCDVFCRSRTFTLGLLTLVVVLLFADQNLLAPNLSAVAEEFGFDGAC